MAIDTNHAQFLYHFLANNLKGEEVMTLKLMSIVGDDAMTLRLTDELPTVATLLHHAFLSGPWFLSVIRRHHANWSENKLIPFEGNPASLLDACRTLAAETENLLESFRVDELVVDVNFNNEVFPAVYMIDWQTVYLVHHRALAVSTMLRHGLKPPVPYGQNG